MTTELHPSSPGADLDCADASDLLPAYALGAVEPNEQRAIEAHLASCPACRAVLDRYDGVADLLGTAIVPVAPPPALRARLLDEAAWSGTVPVSPAPPTPAKRWSGLPTDPIVLSRWAAAGYGLVATLLVVGLVAAGLLLRQTRDERDFARQGQAEVIEYLRNGGVVTPLAAAGAGSLPFAGTGSVVVTANQPQGMILVDGFLPSDDDHIYRVWVARAGERTQIDELRVTADGCGWLIFESPEPLVTYDTIGITLAATASTERQDLLVAPIQSGSSV